MSYCSNSHGGNGGEVRASHILVKHQGSRRKASWKDPEGQVIRNTTRDSIISQLKAFRDNIVSVKSKFEDIASRSSNCSSTNRAGELGSIRVYCRIKPSFQAEYKNIIDFIGEDGSLFILDPSKTLKGGRK
ncbi:hypothetical protein Ahy_B10g101257 [Arachis hypogaea]|uniref:Peptidyl-prolyl cis-trans isomerase n=1 Tax=Arachis hypogaea TaxID=3818 RepID=A0A444WYZ3_ARAHY|nr:hypothetical protein Ahy_B10g101257 [Arachis hypogaea]